MHQLRLAPRNAPLLLALFIGSVGCERSLGPDTSRDVMFVTVTPTQETVSLGGTLQLEVTLRDKKGVRVQAEVTWVSSEPSVASVDGAGLVTGLAEGTASIKASVQDKLATANIAVVDRRIPDAPSGLTVGEITARSVALTWSDGSTNEAEFRVGRAIGQGEFLTVLTVPRDTPQARDTSVAGTTTYRYRVSACNANGCSTPSEAVEATTPRAPLVIETEELTRGVVQTAYEATLEATGGDGTYTWEVAGGTLPDGLTLEPDTGRLSGVPSSPADLVLTIGVHSEERTTTKELGLRIGFPPPSITTITLPAGSVGRPYAQALSAAGGDGQYLWSLTAESELPAGLTLSESGGLTGTPEAAGVVFFTVVVTSDEQSVEKPLSVTINPPLGITTATLPNAVQGKPYAQSITLSGGTAPFSWAIEAGALPSGITLGSGSLQGTPTGVGTSSFTLRVTSAHGEVVTRAFTLLVAPALVISTISLPNAVKGSPYSVALSASGGTGARTWSLASGALPDGMTLNATTGAISGTTSASGVRSFSARAQSEDGQAVTKAFSITTYERLTVTTASVSAGAVDQAYSTTLAASGGIAPYTWSLASGALPSGVSLSTNGLLSGTPSREEAKAFTAQASSADGQSATASLVLTVEEGPLSVKTTSLSDATLSRAYSRTLEAQGGDGLLHEWSVIAGALPPGLALSGATGEISGTPTQLGASTFTVEVTSGTQSSVRELALEVTDKPAFEITLDYRTSMSDAARAAFEAAKARWERAITMDLPDLASAPALDTSGPGDFPGTCPSASTIDDVRIFVFVEPIDGPLNTLGVGGPCYLRPTSKGLPATGRMIFDSADLTYENLEDLVLHEMGHVLGIGTLWGADFGGHNLLSGVCSGDPIFTGSTARVEFDASGGISYAGGKVPVENTGGSGTSCSHWRESVFESEVMTGFIERGENPLSRLTIGSLQDLGYSVDFSEADPFTIVPVPGAKLRPPSPGARLLGADALPPPRTLAPR